MIKIVVAASLVSAAAFASPKTEVCPVLRSATPILEMWEGEGVWPACPVASPIQSMGARCVAGKGAGCMQPCSRTTTRDGKLLDEAVYTYTKGVLSAVTQTSHFGAKPFVQHASCTLDGSGHRKSCKSDSGETRYTFAHGLLAASEYAGAKHQYKRDKANRLVGESWASDGAPVTTTYTYDGDQLAKIVVADRNTVTTTFDYAKGRRTGMHTVPSDRSFKSSDIAYTYDDAGRVTEETSTGATNEKVTYTYDANGRLAKQVRDLGRDTYTTEYAYSCKK